MIDDPNWPMEYEATFGEGNQPSDRGVIRFVCHDPDRGGRRPILPH